MATDDQQPAYDDTPLDAPVGPGAVVPLAGSFTNTATPIENPQSIEANRRRDVADKEAAESAAAVGPLTGKVLAAKAAGETKLSELEKAQAGERLKLGTEYGTRATTAADDYGKRVAEDAAHLKMLDDAAATAKPHEFWEDKSQWDKVKAHIAMGLGAFGAALTHTPNFALDQIQAEIDHYDKAQKEAIDRKFTIAERAAERLKGTKEEREKALSNIYEQRRLAESTLLHTQEMQAKSISNEALAQQTAAGIPEAIAKQNATVKAGDALREEHRATNMMRLNGTRTVQTAQHEVVNRGGMSAAEKEAATAVRAGNNDPSGKAPGEVIGHVPTGRGGAQGFATRDTELAIAAEKMRALRDDIKENGEHVFSPEKVKRRNTLYADAVGAVANVSPLGKSNESIEIEKGSIGSSGAPSLTDLSGSVAGANLDAVEKKLVQMEGKRTEHRNQTLIPVAGGPVPTGKTVAPPPAPSAPRKLSAAELAGGSFVP